MLKKIVVLLLFLHIIPACTQDQKQDYLGNWIGQLPDKNCFNFKIVLEKIGPNDYQVLIRNSKKLINHSFNTNEKNLFNFSIEEQLHFKLNFNSDSSRLKGYLKTGKLYYYIELQKTEQNKFIGDWNPMMLDNGLISNELFLNVDHYNNQLEAYPFLGDQRSRGFWTKNFIKKDGTLSFVDDFTGFRFKAHLLKDRIELGIYLLDSLITKTTLSFSEEYWEHPPQPDLQNQNTNTPESLNDGWITANLDEVEIQKEKLITLIDSINADVHVNMHSVLIAKGNKLVFEAYFDGFNANIPHDLRSASKSISSAMIGIAIDDGIINSVDDPLYDFIPSAFQYTKDSLKANIRIKDLLTMSSGLDVNKEASENNYQSSSNPWLETVLNAPMVKKPGTYADYGSANPFLLGVILNERLNEHLADYMDKKLFTPLGITNYVNQTDDSKDTPYFGGGMLLTPRDLLKFGQLYLNNGQWNGQQIISKKWVSESFGQYGRLQDTKDKNEYGYLWWHDTYRIKKKNVKTIEARGAGGQFIFIIPELEAVVVTTAGNFRNRKGNQSRELFRDYILPAMVE